MPGNERGAWPAARFSQDPSVAEDIAGHLFGGGPAPEGCTRLAPRGTNFQIKVWQAPLAIPRGAVVTYAMIGQAIGAPKAARAVGGACAANPMALPVPCHRVLRNSGALGGHAFGTGRKRASLAWEAATPGERQVPGQSGRGHEGAGTTPAQPWKPSTSAME